MITAVHQIQRLTELGMLSPDEAGTLIDELEAVQFGTRGAGSLRHLRARYLCGRVSPETYQIATRVSRVGWGVAVMLTLMGIALILCLRDPGSIPSRDMALPSLLAIGMGVLTTTVLHLADKPGMRRDQELRRALESD